jgi:hypothetical protein
LDVPIPCEPLSSAVTHRDAPRASALAPDAEDRLNDVDTVTVPRTSRLVQATAVSDPTGQVSRFVREAGFAATGWA